MGFLVVSSSARETHPFDLKGHPWGDMVKQGCLHLPLWFRQQWRSIHGNHQSIATFEAEIQEPLSNQRFGVGQRGVVGCANNSFLSPNVLCCLTPCA